MPVREVFPGAWIFEPETDPVKIEIEKQKHEEWLVLFKEITRTKKEHGWDSPECQLARIDLSKWQQGRRKEFDQALNQ